MPKTKRYNVGPEQGFRQATTMKLTDEEARRMGLTSKQESKMKTTADNLAQRNRYAEAMTAQDEMRAAEAAAAAEESTDDQAAAAESDDQAAPEAPNKKRGTRSRS